MKIGIVNEDIWDFFHDIYACLQETHQTSLFKRRQYNLPILNQRINDNLLSSDLQRFMRSNDVLFFEWGSELLALATQLPKTCGIVTRLHRYDVYRWGEKVNWDAVDKIILVSQAKQKEFAAKNPSLASKIVVIPEAVNLNRFKPSPKTFSGDLGILCHLKPRKRVYDLILTFYELTQKVDGFHLHIGGGMQPAFRDYYEAMQSLVARLNMQEKVTFYGRVNNPQDWYHKIDIFISNSFSEGLQVSPMEAIASGCYCLSHYWDGADELLPEENLFFTGSELQEKILDYYEASETERATKKLSLQSMVCEKFNVDRTKLQIRELVEEIGLARKTGIKNLS